MEALNKRRTNVSGFRPVKTEHSYAYSVSGGAGGRGTKISTAGYIAGAGGNFGGWHENSEILGIWNEKQSMQQLNDRLSNYLEQVRKLEEKNQWLEVNIREATEKKGPLAGADHSKYYAIIADLKAKVSRGVTKQCYKNTNGV